MADPRDRRADEEASRGRIARRLEGIVLSDSFGERVPLESCWADRPVVLVFIRHFG